MKVIRVYRNPDCARCARFAKAHHYLDWLHRVDASTEAPRSGPLQLGEVVVEDLSSGRILRGVEGIELIFRNIPAYMPFLPLLKLPFVRRYIDRETSGCGGTACAL